MYQVASSSAQEVVENKGTKNYGSVGNQVDEKGHMAREIDGSCKQQQLCE